MATRIFPAHLMGPLTKLSVKRGVTRRLHNRRISMVVTPEGAYQLHIAKALEPGEAAELRAQGQRDSLEDYILRPGAVHVDDAAGKGVRRGGMVL